MKISVITACFNNEATIADTVRSVLEQDHDDVEYIIVDGASTDGTMKVIDEFHSRITKIISEKDNGIYFALNKGIKLASGDVIAFLHADDVYANAHILSRVNRIFSEKKVSSVYGDLVYVERNDLQKTIRRWISCEYYDGIFRKGWMPPHPSFFLTKKCYDEFGMFNTEFRTAADYELMLRMLHRNKISTAYIHEVLVKMRAGGMSNKTVKNRIRANREDRRAWKVNGLNPGFFTLTRKPLSKILQFFRKG
ncbi:MAG: glycosyltransferase [Bacteroidetes bacterium]|nr:glycosyltransferase [Bacteroidota bacterium]